VGNTYVENYSSPTAYCLFLMAERFPVTAWKPVLIVCTEQELWQVMHWRKNNLVSLFRMVSGDLQVWQVTYSLIYLLRTFSICFCWNRPFMMSELPPSMAPLVPNSANRKASKCLGCLWSILAISAKLANPVFLLPTLTTCGGLITNFFFSPATISGLFTLIIPKTLWSSSS